MHALDCPIALFPRGPHSPLGPMAAVALLTLITLVATFGVGCAADTGEGAPAEEAPTGAEGEELGLGEILDLGDLKADSWGFATECKPIPDVPALIDPYIVVSLEGLTLHLIDRAGDYDRVFPIGVGVIEDGESLTPHSLDAPEGLFYTASHYAGVVDGATPQTARWAWNYSCRMWWTDERGERLPVFAGLPFIRLEGPRTSGYAFHGPIDGFTRPNGGDLRRGYVSHGCVRMEAADIVELYARIEGRRTPVRIQRAIERDSDDRAVDVADPWLMAECESDADCPYEGGICRQNGYSGRGFCTLACDRYCPDRYGYATTFCVDDPATDRGMCVLQASSHTNDCRRFDDVVATRNTPRNGQSSVRRTVCLPGTEGWIGDPCQADGECLSGYCHGLETDVVGMCSEACTRYCPDLDGHAATFCVSADPAAPENGGMCVAQCADDDECGVGYACNARTRHGQSSVVRNVCEPVASLLARR